MISVILVLVAAMGCTAGPEAVPEGPSSGPQIEQVNGSRVQEVQWEPGGLSGDLAIYLRVVPDVPTECTFTFGMGGEFPEEGGERHDRVGGWFQEDSEAPRIRGIGTDITPEAGAFGTSSSSYAMSGASWGGTASFSDTFVEPFRFFAVGTNLAPHESQLGPQPPAKMVLSCGSPVRLDLFRGGPGSALFTSSSIGGGLTLAADSPGADAESTVGASLTLEPGGRRVVTRALHQVEGPGHVTGEFRLAHPGGEEIWELPQHEAFWALDGVPGTYQVSLDRSGLAEEVRFVGMVLGLERIEAFEDLPMDWSFPSGSRAR